MKPTGKRTKPFQEPVTYSIQIKPKKYWREHSSHPTRLEARFTLKELTLSLPYPVRLVIQK